VKLQGERELIVFDLGCENNHRFEGWFTSNDDFEQQLHGKLITCPLCSNGNVVRLPHASHIKSGGKPRHAPPGGKDQQYANVGKEILVKLVEQILEHTEDVGAGSTTGKGRYGESGAPPRAKRSRNWWTRG
jgi:hypothetical protein